MRSSSEAKSCSNFVLDRTKAGVDQEQKGGRDDDGLISRTDEPEQEGYKNIRCAERRRGMMEGAEFIRRLETKEALGRFDRARDAVGSSWTDATWVLMCKRSGHALSVLTIALTICDYD